MATTKIWPTNRLDKAVSYVMSPTKTENGRWITTINVINDEPKQIISDMMATKKVFGKDGGRQGYHMEQSFAPGEVTPQQAHQIGVELAQQLFGDDFEVVVATHVDKSHIHNHIVTNSVSLVDGHKYHEPNSEYYDRIRKISDQLCEKYKLSVVKDPKDRRYRSYPEQHHAENPSYPTTHNIIYADIDKAIEHSSSLSEFYQVLQEMGYQVKLDGKYPAIAPEGRRFFRLYKFAAGYTEDDIQDRIRAKVGRQRSESQTPEPKKHEKHNAAEHHFYGNWNSPQDYARCAYRFHVYFIRRYSRRSMWQTYIQYRYLLRSVQRERYPRYPSVDLRKELNKLNQYSRQAVLLTKNHIDTEEQLQEYLSGLDKQVHSINKEKWYLKREAEQVPADSQQELKDKIQALEQEAKPLIREKFLCRDILKRCSMVQDQVDREKEEAVKQAEPPQQSQEERGREF